MVKYQDENAKVETKKIVIHKTEISSNNINGYHSKSDVTRSCFLCRTSFHGEKQDGSDLKNIFKPNDRTYG